MLAGDAEVSDGAKVKRVSGPATVVLRAGHVRRIGNAGASPRTLVASLFAVPAGARGADGTPLPLLWER